MHIQSVRFTNPDRDEIEVTSDLGDFYLPWPCDTWHRQAIHQWLEMGNKIQPFLPEVDVEKARKALSREVYRHAAQLLDEATADYSMIEKVIHFAGRPQRPAPRSPRCACAGPRRRPP